MSGVLLAMRRFHPLDRDTDLLLPLSVQDWLSKGHLARYVVEVVEGLDLSLLVQAYGGAGSPAYHPAMLLALLIYGYATGCFSSRKIERATYDALAFRFIACNLHPDHDTLATFRRRFRQEFEVAFVQVLEVARENRFSQFGSVCLDGTKIHANASRHSALSYGPAEALEAHLQAEVQELLALAERTDSTQVPDGMSIPAELARREERLAAIAAAKTKIAARPPASNWAAPPPRPRRRVREWMTRSISPTTNRGSCRSPVVASSSATTPRPGSIPRACWWWSRRSCSRRSTTSSKWYR